MEIYIIRIFLESSKNPLEAEDINVFSDLEDAKKYVIELCEKNKLKVKNNDNKRIIFVIIDTICMKIF